MRCHSRPRAFNPSLITQHVNEDTAVGRASPNLPLLPITALDLTLHGLDGVSGEQIRHREQHIARRTHHGRLSGARPNKVQSHKRPAMWFRSFRVKSPREANYLRGVQESWGEFRGYFSETLTEASHGLGRLHREDTRWMTPR